MSTNDSGRWGPSRQASSSPAIVDLSLRERGLPWRSERSTIPPMCYPRFPIDYTYQEDSHVDPELLQVPDFDSNTAATDSPAFPRLAIVSSNSVSVLLSN